MEAELDGILLVWLSLDVEGNTMIFCEGEARVRAGAETAEGRGSRIDKDGGCSTATSAAGVADTLAAETALSFFRLFLEVEGLA